MDLTLEKPINVNEVLSQIESVVIDVSKVKDKHMFSNDEEYEKIKIIIEQLQSKTKEAKLKIGNFIDNIDPIDLQKQNVLIENATKKIEQYKIDLEQLKKGKQSHAVKY